MLIEKIDNVYKIVHMLLYQVYSKFVKTKDQEEMNNTAHIINK